MKWEAILKTLPGSLSTIDTAQEFRAVHAPLTWLEGGRHGPFFKALGRQDRWINLERLDRCVGCNCVFSIFGRPRCWIHLLLCFFFTFLFF